MRDTAHRPGGCWTCTHWHGQTTGNGSHAVCTYRGPIIVGNADVGCVYWEREPGADDEILSTDERIARAGR
ncbi:hypothetical protein CAL26_21275 [Bordetella genomosp. 9]|uniref:Uncharacterized protein n=1 Tax=Bordetella genomosp. 9 TaxID=1416803 RepID=A0A261R8Z8_9BORD|nr:hypothetical protein CAL26_21275 [Bordetella genomosp. 9]